MIQSPILLPAGESHHLHSGRPVWDLLDQPAGPPLSALPAAGVVEAEIAIIGAGITGAMLAERLSRPDRHMGHGRIVVIDRHGPACGSTAASTALVQWEIDTPLVELETRIGFERAAATWRRIHAAVAGLADQIDALGIACDLRAVPSLYLSGNTLDPLQLRDEHRLRQRAGLPGDYLPAGSLPERWRLATPEAALLSPGALEIDPVRLTRALLAIAVQRGCRLLAPLRVAGYEIGPGGVTTRGVTIHCEQGVAVRASRLVLASGYEMPPFVQATTQFDVTSTWAMATAPQPQGPLPAMLWEAAEPYIYLRSTADGRLMIGGGDAPVADAATREALAPEKIARLQQRLAALLPHADTRIATSWSGRFGVTADGLPLIGPVPDHPGCFAAYGYGGNGVTFSMIAADILAGLLAGSPVTDPAAPAFALDR